MYSFCICVFTLTAAAVSKDDSKMSCKSDYKGVFELFRYLDPYFHFVDELLCSDSCPCYFSNQTAYDELKENNPMVKLEDVVEGSVHFGQCKNNIRQKTDDFLDEDHDLQKMIGNIDQAQFQIYWKRIEKKFHCVGWCQTTYKQNVKLQKYLFSDVNGGLVHNPGCMKRMLDWLPKMLNTFGSILLLISIVQVVSIVFVMSLFCDCGLEESNKHIERQEDNIPMKAKNNFENDNDNRVSEMRVI